tara:strand:+ start:405 stop:1232 length:828 start_codon:yes stop_codon:yes gene_type:complete
MPTASLKKPSVAHRTELRGVSLIVTQREMQAIIAATSQDRKWLLGCWERLEERRTKTVKSAGPINSNGRRKYTTTNGAWAKVHSLAKKKAEKLNRKVRDANRKAFLRNRPPKYTTKSFTGEELVDLWESLLPQLSSAYHSVAVDDLQCGYTPDRVPQHKWDRRSKNWAWKPNGEQEMTILDGTAGAPTHELIDIENAEIHGDSFITKEFQEQAEARLAYLKDWRDGMHPLGIYSQNLLDAVWNAEYVGPDDEDLYERNYFAVLHKNARAEWPKLD